MFNFITSNSYFVLEQQMFEKIEAIEKNKTKEAIIFTPEQFVLETNKGLAKNISTGTSFFSEVHSFTSITNRYIEEFGKEKILLNSVGKKVLLQKAVFNLQDKLVFYKKTWDKVSFIENLGSTIDEIINSKVSIETLEELCGNKEDDFSLKLSDILIIYKEFLSLLNKEFIISEDILDFVSTNIENFTFLKDKEIHFIGFNGFVKRELGFIEALAHSGHDINLYLTLDKKVNIKAIMDKSFYIGDFDPYFEPKRTLYTIYSMFLEKSYNDIKIYEFFEKEEEKSQLGFLRKNFFKNSITLEEDVKKDVKIYTASTDLKEIQLVSSKICELIKEENLKFSDFVILCDNIDKYSIAFKKVFEPLNIPYFTDLKEPILNDELIKFILNIFDVYIFNFNYESVFNLLKNDYCRFQKEDGNLISKSDIERFENYCLRYNIRGYMFQKPFTYIKGVDNEEEAKEYDIKYLEKINETRLAFLNSLEFLKKYQKGEFLIKDFLDDLFNFLEENKVYDELNRRFNIESDEKISARASQVWNKLVDVFENIHKLLCDHKTNFFEMRKILEAGFSDNEFRYVPNNIDVIKVVDVFRSRFSSTKYLFIIGATEGSYPTFSKNKTFFTDDDIEVFKEKDLRISSDSFMQMNVQNLNIYNSIYKTTTGLFVTYPTNKISGEENKPSYLVNRLKTILNIEEESFRKESLPLGEVYKIILQKEAKTEEDILFLQRVDDYISRLNFEILQKIFKKEFTLANIKDYKDLVLLENEYSTSISKIETYNNCPYSHFLRYDLKIYPRDEYEVDASSFGIVYHSMLESFFNSVQKDTSLDLKTLDKKFIEDFVNEHIKEFSKGREDNILNANARFRYYVKNISDTLKSSIDNYKNQFALSEFDFYKSEVSVKEQFKTASGEVIKYKGYIDRVDVAIKDDQIFVRTIDYKSSQKDIDINSVIAGKSLQLLKYLEILLKKSGEFDESDKEKLPAGALYLTLKDEEYEASNVPTNQKISPNFENYRFHGILNDDTTEFYNQEYHKEMIGTTRATKPKRFTKKDFELVLEYADFKVKETVGKILDGNIGATPVSHSVESTEISSPCNYCDYKGLCQIKERPENRGKILYVDKEASELTEKQRKRIQADMGI